MWAHRPGLSSPRHRHRDSGGRAGTGAGVPLEAGRGSAREALVCRPQALSVTEGPEAPPNGRLPGTAEQASSEVARSPRVESRPGPGAWARACLPGRV